MTVSDLAFLEKVVDLLYRASDFDRVDALPMAGPALGVDTVMGYPSTDRRRGLG